MTKRKRNREREEERGQIWKKGKRKKKRESNWQMSKLQSCTINNRESIPLHDIIVRNVEIRRVLVGVVIGHALPLLRRHAEVHVKRVIHVLVAVRILCTLRNDLAAVRQRSCILFRDGGPGADIVTRIVCVFGVARARVVLPVVVGGGAGGCGRGCRSGGRGFFLNCRCGCFGLRRRWICG